MKKIILAGMTITVIGLFLSARAEQNASIPPQQVFADANKLYEAGQLDQALESYLALTKQGYQGRELSYNLGNVYYKRGERGKAILWFERALRLDPRDSDTRFNLTLARSHIKEEETSLGQKLILSLSEKELGFTLMGLSWLFFISLGVYFLRGNTLNPAGGAVLWCSGIFLLFSATWFFARVYVDYQPWTIVTSPPGEVRNGPGTEYAVGFTIPEGSKVLILNKRPEWTQVGVPQQGLKGWMPTREIETIEEKTIS